MKLNRTLAGKILLILSCLISLTLFALSFVGIAHMTQRQVYLLSEEKANENQFFSRMQAISHELLSGYWGGGIFYTDYARHEESNLLVQVKDEKGEVLYQNFSQEAPAFLFTQDYVLRSYEIEDDRVNYDIFKKEEPRSPHDIYWRADQPIPFKESVFTIAASLKEDLPYWDIFRFDHIYLHLLYTLRLWIYPIALLLLILHILSFVALVRAAGKRNGTEEIHTGPFYGIPFDLLFCLNLVALSLYYILIDDLYYYRSLAAILLFPLAYLSILGLILSACVRIRKNTLWQNCICSYIFIWIIKCLKSLWKILKSQNVRLKQIYHSLSLVWRTALFLLLLTFLQFILIMLFWDHSGIRFFLWIVHKMITIPVLLYLAVTLRTLQKAGIALANGDLHYKTNTEGMFWDFKQHGEHLNNLGKGLILAVEERMHSERMKTELITNVSHDLKTPLTSIINYAGLIAQEKCENEKITQYSEVLVKKSENLKRLIEDLVEVSKASTGNLEVQLSPCDPNIFLTQASGEYEEKLHQANLPLIVQGTEKEVKILADGRRMWRIFDNLMNNISKYAQSGTRVYLTLEVQNGQAVFTFKNISRDPLNISQEELLERFVRGSKARTTEGNGLGLSIARSLTELQKGQLHLAIDGDLFKVILSFPTL